MPAPGATLRVMLDLLTKRFAACGVDSPRLSAEVLLAHAHGLERAELLKTLILEPETLVREDVASRILEYAARRENREPVAYITGSKEFYGRDFTVTPDTLIPRPETELLVEAALAFAAEYPEPGLFLDMGTGSGCIAVTMALELRGWQGLALDRSMAALSVARRNARALSAERLGFVRADFYAPPVSAGTVRMILANPPYVSEAEYCELSPEVREHEPRTALVPETLVPETLVSGAAPRPCIGSLLSPAKGGEDLAGIIALAPRLLEPGGRLLMEMGAGQGDMVRAMLDADIWRNIFVRQDMAGLDRLLTAQKR